MTATELSCGMVMRIVLDVDGAERTLMSPVVIICAAAAEKSALRSPNQLASSRAGTPPTSFAPMIAAMKACTCNMYRAAQRGFLNATDLADYLTKKGLPFRAAYKIAGQLVAYCIEHTAVLEELPLALLRQYSERFDEDVYAAIALTNCVTGRTSLGGTCVASVEAQIASVRDFLAGQTEAAKQAENG